MEWVTAQLTRGRWAPQAGTGAGPRDSAGDVQLGQHMGYLEKSQEWTTQNEMHKTGNRRKSESRVTRLETHKRQDPS